MSVTGGIGFDGQQDGNAHEEDISNVCSNNNANISDDGGDDGDDDSDSNSNDGDDGDNGGYCSDGDNDEKVAVCVYSDSNTISDDSD